MIAVEPRMKPSRWAVERGLIEPDWLWAWKGKIGHWVFWEGGGGKLVDISGFRNHGTLTNMDPSTDWIGTQYGGALDFAADSDARVEIPGSIVTNMSEFTIIITGRFNSASANSTAYSESDNTTDTTSGLTRILFGDSSPGRCFELFRGGGTRLSFGDSADFAGQLNQVAVVERSVADRELFVNGVSRDTDATSLTLGTALVTTIGGWLRSSGFIHPYNGSLVTVTVLSRALTPNEIRLLYENPFADIRPWYESAPAVFAVGDIVITPPPAVAASSAIAPTVVLGSITFTPDAAPAAGSAVAPQVVLGSVTVTPDAAAAASAAIDPAVVQGAITVTPPPAEVVSAALPPDVVLGSVTVTPPPAAGASAALDPGVVLGSVTVTPDPAIAASAAIAPIIAGGFQPAPYYYEFLAAAGGA